MRFTVPPEGAGKRLLDLLKEKSLNISRRQLKRQVDNGYCRVNGCVETYGSVRLKKGDHIELEKHSPTKTEITNDHLLFVDEDLVFVNKPTGIATDGPALGDALLTLVGPVYCVHRLDKGTSGVVVFARNAAAEIDLLRQFKAREVKKRYLAVVGGEMTQDEGVCESWLGLKKRLQGQKLWGSVQPAEGRKAVTAWRCKKKGRGISVVECFPQTGRTHQVRIHLKEEGHPILGDVLYGRDTLSAFRSSRLLLHACELELTHPVSKKKVSVTAPLPDEFKVAMAYIDPVLQKV